MDTSELRPSGVSVRTPGLLTKHVSVFPVRFSEILSLEGENWSPVFDAEVKLRW